MKLSIFMERTEKLKVIGKKAGIDAFLITSETNMRYFAGFSVLSIERFAAMIIPVETGAPMVIVPKLEEEKTREQSAFKEVRSYDDSENPAVLLSKIIKRLKLEKAVFGVEGTLPFKFYKMLAEYSSKIRTEDVSTIFSQLRTIKSDDELRKMKKAAEIVAEGIKAGIEFIKPGVSELATSSEIERAIKKNGGESIPFCMVLSGSNSALPHGAPSSRKVREKDVVLMDIGTVYEGYYADLTRTVFVGKVAKEQREVYNIVAEAQETAIQSVKPNVKAGEIDAAARKIIEKAGYGKCFTHRTGHGLGLEVHEEPYIAPGNETVLKPGMAFTIEPGIYLFGKFGVRIEDDIAVSGRKGKMLSNLSRELLII